MENRVKDQPDWLYLLREYYEMYRFLPAGGSRAIRSHQKQVREAISRLMKSNPVLRESRPAQLPVTAHLRRTQVFVLTGERLRARAKTTKTASEVRLYPSWQIVPFWPHIFE